MTTSENLSQEKRGCVSRGVVGPIALLAAAAVVVWIWGGIGRKASKPIEDWPTHLTTPATGCKTILDLIQVKEAEDPAVLELLLAGGGECKPFAESTQVLVTSGGFDYCRTTTGGETWWFLCSTLDKPSTTGRVARRPKRPTPIPTPIPATMIRETGKALTNGSQVGCRSKGLMKKWDELLMRGAINDALDLENGRLCLRFGPSTEVIVVTSGREFCEGLVDERLWWFRAAGLKPWLYDLSKLVEQSKENSPPTK